GGWTGDGQRSRSGSSRGSRRAGDRIHPRSFGRAVLAFRTVGPRAGRLVAIVRRTISLLSRTPAGPGHVARLHRHDPRGPAARHRLDVHARILLPTRMSEPRM